MGSRIPMSGAVESLLAAMQRLVDDHDSADIVFLLGRDEERVHAHRIILAVRLTSFQQAPTAGKQRGQSVGGGGGGGGSGELCRIPGSSVGATPSTPGAPTPIRLPHIQADVFKQFINYVYTGKVSGGEQKRYM